MTISAIEFLLLGVGAFILAGTLTWPVRKVALWIGAMDLPDTERKTQKEAVPYLGGVSIAASICILTYSTIYIADDTATTFPLVSYLLVPAVVMGLMGLIDDLRGLQPWPRLIFQTLVGIVISVIIIKNQFTGSPTGNELLDNLLFIVWIVGMTNSINFFDNLDGGAAGTVAISAFGISFIAYSGGQQLVTALSFVTACACLGFLLWNRAPARIYMGDAGALFLGVVVSVLTIRLDSGIQPQWLSLTLLPVLLAVPILDTCVAVLSRLRRGISPFQGGRDHLSHRLMRKGLSKKNAAFALWAMQAGFVASAVLIYQRSEMLGRQALVVTLTVWLGAFIWFWRIPSSDQGRLSSVGRASLS